jgi:hypothetical protein
MFTDARTSKLTLGYWTGIEGTGFGLYEITAKFS